MRNYPIRLKLLAAFLVVAIFVSAILLVQSVFSEKKTETEKLVTQLERYKSLVLNSTKAQQDFISIDLSSDRFYLTETSERLDDHAMWQRKMEVTAKEIASLPMSSNLRMQEAVSELEEYRIRHNKAFLTLVESTKALGFKDFGITGEMREYAHLIEDSFPDLVPLAEILMLRRHEKDFIIRKEEKYAERFDLVMNKILSRLNEEEPTPRLAACHTMLANYSSSFDLICIYNRKNGLSNNTGLKAELDKAANDLLTYTDGMILLSQEKTLALIREFRLYFYLAIFICIAVILILVNYLSGLLSRPITALAQHTEAFVKSNFNASLRIDRFEHRNDELGTLYQHFRKLGEEITVHFKNYREAAENRHRQILEKNIQIEEQHKQLEKQKDLLSARNKSVLDSIVYANRLQQALLPDTAGLENLLGEHLLIYKPKDIVSGDFYYAEETPDSIFFAVADCTGHGVPGAFMSLLGNNFLNQAIKELELRNTNEILDYLNLNIAKLLNQYGEEGEIKDGMDIALCRWIKAEKTLQYSGANRPLILVRQGELIAHNSDRLPIGWSFETARKPFTAKKVAIEPGDRIFLFSDGFYDQFGGQQNKKFKFNRFRSLLSECGNESMRRCQAMLSSAFSAWKGRTEQVDDICVLGITADHLLNIDANRAIRSESIEKPSPEKGSTQKFRVVN